MVEQPAVYEELSIAPFITGYLAILGNAKPQLKPAPKRVDGWWQAVWLAVSTSLPCCLATTNQELKDGTMLKQNCNFAIPSFGTKPSPLPGKNNVYCSTHPRSMSKKRHQCQQPVPDPSVHTVCSHNELDFINPSAATVCYYITCLTRCFISAKSIMNYVSSIRFLFKQLGLAP